MPGRLIVRARGGVAATAVVAFGVAFGVTVASAGSDAPSPRATSEATLREEPTGARAARPARLHAVARLPGPRATPAPARRAPAAVATKPAVAPRAQAPTPSRAAPAPAPAAPPAPPPPAPAAEPEPTFDSSGTFDSAG